MSTNNLATPQTWQIAQARLNDSDMKRLACCYFFSDHTKVDYESAAAAYGSASANSFRVMLSAAVKKVRDIEANGGVPLPSPAKPRGGGKRKKGDDDETPKKVGRPKKAKVVEGDDDGARVDEGIAGIDGVKEEEK